MMKISETQAVFRRVSTQIEALTFEEIAYIHEMNYKGSGNVYRGNGYVTDVWGHHALEMDLDRLRKEVEASRATYVVELDYPWLRFSPAGRTLGELMACRNGAKALEHLN